MLLPTIVDVNVMSAVVPMSAVDVSVYTVGKASFHTVINSPALAFVPLYKVYFPKADLYDPVA